MREKDLIGAKIGRLLVIEESKERTKCNKKRFLCRCDCGNLKTIQSNHLLVGATNSCGCLSKEAVTTHGRSKDKIYSVWEGIKGRCLNKNNKYYWNYGGRGIGVCDEWLEFENFYKDMGEIPVKNYEIDRIDNNKGYSKENCRWVEKSVNQHNRNSLKNSSSKYKGVLYYKAYKKWSANIFKKGKNYFLGYFETQEEAAIAYNNKAVELYGEFASPNVIEETSL